MQSRYYDAEVGRFINGDSYINATGSTQTVGLCCYCYNNPITFFDPNGKMPVLALNILRKMYERNIVSGQVISILTILMNSEKTYLYFHEIAQLNLAKELYKKGYKTELEYKIITSKGRREVDVVAKKKYAWEIKPATSWGSAEKQLELYTEKRTKLKRGFFLPTIKGIPFLGDIKMKIQFTSTGAAYYSLYNKRTGSKVSTAQVFRDLKRAITLAKIAAYGIVIATIAEDIWTGGAGISNDGPSLTAAASSANIILFKGVEAVLMNAA